MKLTKSTMSSVLFSMTKMPLGIAALNTVVSRLKLKKKDFKKYLLKYFSLTVSLKKSQQSIPSGMRKIMPSLAQKLKISKFRASFTATVNLKSSKNKLFTHNNQFLFI